MRKTYLQLTFIISDGTKFSINVQDANELLDKDEVKSSMDSIVELDVIEKNGMSLTAPYSAKYITRTVNEIYTEK